MNTQEEQYVKVIGTVHDPFEDHIKKDPFASLEIFDEVITVNDDEKQAFSKQMIQYAVRNYRQ